MEWLVGNSVLYAYCFFLRKKSICEINCDFDRQNIEKIDKITDDKQLTNTIDRK